MGKHWEGGWDLKGFLGLSMGSSRANTTQTGENKKRAYLWGRKQKLCLYLKMGVRGEMSSTRESTEELFVAHCRMRHDKLMLPT